MVCFNLSYKGILWLLLSIGNWDFSYYKILTEKLYHHCRMFTVGIMRDGTVGMISDGSSLQFEKSWFVQNLTAAVPTAWLKVKVQLQALKWCSFNSKVHHNKAMCRTHPATLLAQCQGHSWRSNVFTVLIPYLSKRFYVYLNKAAGKNHVGCYPRSRSPLKVKYQIINSKFFTQGLRKIFFKLKCSAQQGDLQNT